MTASLLFKVLAGRASEELAIDEMVSDANRLRASVTELLSAVHYRGPVSIRIVSEDSERLFCIYVDVRFVNQADLFLGRALAPAGAELATEIIELTMTNISRLRAEFGAITAMQLEALLDQTRTANLVVIRALCKQPRNGIHIRTVDGDFELMMQTVRGRTIELCPRPHEGVITAVGPHELVLLPFRKGTMRKTCLHPLRVLVPDSLATIFDPGEVLEAFVLSKSPVQLNLQEEIVVRKRRHRTFVLSNWPPALLHPPRV